MKGNVLTQPIHQLQSSLEHLSLHNRHLKSLRTRLVQPQQAQTVLSCLAQGSDNMRIASSLTQYRGPLLMQRPHKHLPRARMRLS